MVQGPLQELGGIGGGGGGDIPGDTVVTETAFGQAANAGAATEYSRRDHTHGTPANPGGMSEDFSIWCPDAPPAVAGADDDEFADASGGLPAGWTEFDPDVIQTVGEDEQGLTLLQATHGGDNMTGIYKAIPAGNFTIAAKVGTLGVPSYAAAGMALWENAAGNNGIYTIELRYGASGVYVIRWTNKTTKAVELWPGGENVLTDVYMRIRRNGTTYYFDVSVLGIGWVQMYTTGSLAFVPSHYGLYINNSGTFNNLVGRFGFFRYKNSDVGITGLLEGDRVGMHRN